MKGVEERKWRRETLCVVVAGTGENRSSGCCGLCLPNTRNGLWPEGGTRRESRDLVIGVLSSLLNMTILPL